MLMGNIDGIAFFWELMNSVYSAIRVHVPKNDGNWSGSTPETCGL